MRRSFCGLLLMVSLFMLSGCSPDPVPPQQEETPESWERAEVFLSFATAQTRAEGSFDALQAELLEQSDGRVYFNFYSEGRMGGDEELMESVRSGSVSVVEMSTPIQAKYVPELSLLDIPYLFSNADECNRQLREQLRDFFQPYYNREGLQLLGWYCSGFRQLSSTEPVASVANLKRLTIRTMDNKYHQSFWSALGVKTKSVPFSDLFYSIQQGVVNAQENLVGAMTSIKLQEVQPHLLLTNHLPFIGTVVMNKASYDALSPEDQRAVAMAFEAYCRSRQDTTVELEDYDQFSSVTAPDDELKAYLEAGAEPVRQELEQDLGSELLQQFYAIVDP